MKAKITQVKTINNKIIKNMGSPSLKHFVYNAILLLHCVSISISISVQAQEAPKKSNIEPIEAIKINKVKTELQYQVEFKARPDHDFILTADYRHFPDKAKAKNTPGVIVLHDCKTQRKKYQNLSISIAEQGLHTLSLDLRGYGNSIDQGFSYLDVKRNATDIVSYQNEVATLMSYWPEDLVAAYQFLRTKVDKSQGISIVASGCSGSYAVGLAEKVHLKSMVLLTPQMSYADKERYKTLIDIPSYFISSAQHALSYATTQELFAWNGASNSKLQVYKGDKINYQIIRSNKYLVNDIALWLKVTLR